MIHRIDPQKPFFDIAQTVRRVHLAGHHIQTDARPRNQIPINAILCRLKLGISPAKSLTVPKVNPCLVLDFDVHVQIVKELPGGNDDFILGLPRHVFIKVENVVILDAPSGGKPGLMIPDRLKKTARRQHALVQANRRQAPGNLGICRIGHRDLNQRFSG